MEVGAIQQMLSRLGKLQEDWQRQVNSVTVEASAGAGMVTVKMNGQKQIVYVRIEQEVFASKDQEMLQDLIRAAVNEASRRVDEELANQMKGLAGGIPGIAGLKIPGLLRGSHTRRTVSRSAQRDPPRHRGSSRTARRDTCLRGRLRTPRLCGSRPARNPAESRRALRPHRDRAFSVALRPGRARRSDSGRCAQPHGPARWRVRPRWSSNQACLRRYTRVRREARRRSACCGRAER